MSHAIFKKPFSKWWGFMALITIATLYLFGMPTMKGYNDFGYILWTMSLLFCGLVFGSIIYLVYRLISGKWNNNVFIVCIAVMWCFVLLTIRR